jgi:hypothetical protein
VRGCIVKSDAVVGGGFQVGRIIGAFGECLD